MKAFLILAILGLALSSSHLRVNSAQSPALGLTPLEDLEITAGFLDGMDIDLGVEDLQKCNIDTLTIDKYFVEAMKDFEEKSFNGYYHGLMAIAEAFGKLPDELVACKACTEETVAGLRKALALFKNPVKLVYVVGETLALDGKDILFEVFKAGEYYGEKDYYHCGEEIGQACFKFATHD